MTEAQKPQDEGPVPPKVGSPEWKAMIEHHKDAVERETGMRPEFLFDIGVGDFPGYGDPPAGDGA